MLRSRSQAKLAEQSKNSILSLMEHTNMPELNNLLINIYFKQTVTTFISKYTQQNPKCKLKLFKHWSLTHLVSSC